MAQQVPRLSDQASKVHGSLAQSPHPHKYICRSVSNKYLLGTRYLTALCQDLATSPCLQGQQAQERNKSHYKVGVGVGWGTLGRITATTEISWEQGIQRREEESLTENGIAVP